jgi:rhodanese-related sulfurtransferase
MCGFRLLCPAVAALALSAGSAAPAADRKPETSGGPYCGIYCLYAAFETLGIEVPFESLLRGEYVGSFQGSSLEELRRAAADHGAHALPLKAMTASSLRAADQPLILHVRRPGYQSTYAHWVLFLGVEDGKARILDPPNGVDMMPFAELLALWDGTGLMVSREPVNGWSVRAGGWLELGVLCAVAVFGVALFRSLVRKSSRSMSRLIAETALFIVLPVALAVLVHSVHDEGFLRNRSAVAEVVGVHFEPDVPELSLPDVLRLLKTPNVSVVDARFPRAYAAGHLPGAKNLPVYAGLPERSRLLAELPPEGPVIVYCQSEYCPWGKMVASDLVLRGRRDVYVFRDGWAGWAEHVKRTTK